MKIGFGLIRTKEMEIIVLSMLQVKSTKFLQEHIRAEDVGLIATAYISV